MAKQTQRSIKPPSKGAKTFSKPPSKKHVQERQAVEEDDDSIEAMVDDDDDNDEDEQEDLSCLSDDEVTESLGYLIFTSRFQCSPGDL